MKKQWGKTCQIYIFKLVIHKEVRMDMDQAGSDKESLPSIILFNKGVVQLTMSMASDK